MLVIKNLSKTYANGKIEALKNVNLSIEEGEFTALLGQNGAGKSTLINILAGNVKKSSGTVQIGRYDLDSDELATKRIIGVVPQEIALDTFFTVKEILEIQSGYFGIKNNNQYIDELLEILSLQDKKRSSIRGLSGGMRRRLLIAKALVHQPKILILDEPTAGVDVDLRNSMHEFLEKLHQLGITIILTTHYLEEAEKLCKRVIIIDKGRIIKDEPKEELLENYSTNISLEIDFDKELGKDDIRFLNKYNPRVVKTRVYLDILKKDLTKLFRDMTEIELEFNNINVKKQSLQDVYLSLVKE